MRIRIADLIVKYILTVVLVIVVTTAFAMAGHASNRMIGFAVLLVAGAIIAMYVDWRINRSEEKQRAAWQVWLFRSLPIDGRLNKMPPVMFVVAVIAYMISLLF